MDNLYDLVVMDPPWDYGGDKFKPTYPVLSMSDLKQLPIKAITSENSILLIWAIGPMKNNAMELIKHYGFSYK